MPLDIRYFWAMKNTVGLFTLVITFSTIASGCLIMIGENSFRSLTTSEIDHILPYESAANLAAKDTAEQQVLYEITAADVMQHARESAYTWMHLWRPWCPNDKCQNIGVFQETAEKYTGLSFFMVSQTYDFASISRITEQSNFVWPVYVIKDEKYGHKLNKSRELLAQDFNIAGGRAFGDNLVFKKDSLIYNGDDAIGFLDSIFAKPTLQLH